MLSWLRRTPRPSMRYRYKGDWNGSGLVFDAYIGEVVLKNSSAFCKEFARTHNSGNAQEHLALLDMLQALVKASPLPWRASTVPLTPEMDTPGVAIMADGQETPVAVVSSEEHATRLISMATTLEAALFPDGRRD